jgi:hypothetical protein
MAERRYITKQVEGGRWKFGVQSQLRGEGYSTDKWTLSLRTYASKSGAAKAAKAYLGSYQAMHNSK